MSLPELGNLTDSGGTCMDHSGSEPTKAGSLNSFSKSLYRRGPDRELRHPSALARNRDRPFNRRPTRFLFLEALILTSLIALWIYGKRVPVQKLLLPPRERGLPLVASEWFPGPFLPSPHDSRTDAALEWNEISTIIPHSCRSRKVLWDHQTILTTAQFIAIDPY